MLDIKNPVQAYEVFKLQWMIEHGATLSDLVHNLQLILGEDMDGSDIPMSLQSLFSDWEFGFGFRGPLVETKNWMKKNLSQESRAFTQEEYAKAGSIGKYLRMIPESRKTEALMHFLRLRYSEYDLDLPFLEQFRRNQEKLLAILFRMAENEAPTHNNEHF